MGILVWLIVILEVDTLFICSLLDQTAANIHAMQYKWHFLTQICEGYPRSKPLSHYQIVQPQSHTICRSTICIFAIDIDMYIQSSVSVPQPEFIVVSYIVTSGIRAKKGDLPIINVGWLLLHQTFCTSYGYHVAREISTFCICIYNIISRVSYVQTRESQLLCIPIYLPSAWEMNQRCIRIIPINIPMDTRNNKV